MTQAIQLTSEQHVHLIGISGTGMSAIARVLLLCGHSVSGSDLRSNAEADALQAMGATVHIGHDAGHVEGADLVIATSAVPDSHVEIVAAKSQGIPVCRRFDVMSAIMADYKVYAVAGTHGKTTTTSMIIHILTEAQKDPSYIVGGVMANTGKNADVGKGEAFVIEADEYGNMFHGLKPNVAVVTSVEFDHPDFFKTPDEMTAAFDKFVNLLPHDGMLIACADDPLALAFAHQRLTQNQLAVTYGLNPVAKYQASNIRYQGDATIYDVVYEGKTIETVTLQVPGKHNILNSLAALIAAEKEGVSFDLAVQVLSTFKGTGRRFDVREIVNDIVVIDDYAHHPTAIVTTIDAARNRYPEHDLWVIWQPHTYSRTQQLWDDYLAAFDEAHHVIVTKIYAAREADNPDVRSKKFVSELTHDSKFHAQTFDDAVDILIEAVQSPAVILIMSAGDAPQIGVDYLTQLKAKSS